MQLVAKRIVDKNILKLIRMWLKALAVEEHEDGKKEYKGNDKGSPQGGVISPLLANICLNVLDTLGKTKKVQERFSARRVRYADAVVILCEGNAERILKGLKAVLSDLGLTLNEAKTKVVDARRDSFEFLVNLFRRPNKKTREHALTGFLREGYLFTASLNALPAENFGTFLAAILIALPVLGFLPVLAFLLESEKVPKPTRDTLSPFFTALVTASIAASSALPAAALLQSAAAAIFSTSSAFVIHIPP
jgi:hypothetical protein